MSRRDPLTGRGPSTGNNRSHSLRATRRTWNVNLQWTTLTIDGQRVRVRLSTKTIRTLRKISKNDALKAESSAPVESPISAEETPAPAAE